MIHTNPTSPIIGCLPLPAAAARMAVIAVLAACMLCANMAAAMADTNRQASSARDVAMLFYKMTGQTPDFVMWAKKTPAYRNAREIHKQDVLKNKSLELELKFNKLEPEEQIIRISTLIPTDVDYKVKDPERRGIYIDWPFEEVPYFPYVYDGLNIAVIADGLENYKFIKLDEPAAKFVAAHKSPGHDTRVVIELLPVAADGEKPLSLDNHRQWPILGKIARLELLNRDNVPLWQYKADWYWTDEGSRLLKLYKR